MKVADERDVVATWHRWQALVRQIDEVQRDMRGAVSHEEWQNLNAILQDLKPLTRWAWRRYKLARYWQAHTARWSRAPYPEDPCET